MQVLMPQQFTSNRGPLPWRKVLQHKALGYHFRLELRSFTAATISGMPVNICYLLRVNNPCHHTTNQERYRKSNLIQRTHTSPFLQEKQDHKQTKHTQDQKQVHHRNYSSLYRYRPSLALSLVTTYARTTSTDHKP